MIQKNAEKEQAIVLRKQGFSYNEILRNVPVAKSTLSVWLKDIGIAKEQKQRLTEKRKAAQQKAQEACRNNRICKENIIISNAKAEITNISARELWLIGTVLYWAEGSKQKEKNVSQKVSFGNSDPKMIVLFHRWLKECCDVTDDRFYFCIYIHESADVLKARKFWSDVVGTKIDNVYLKDHNPKTTRKNVGADYNGLLRIEVRKSTDLNRKIKGWILGISDGLK